MNYALKRNNFEKAVKGCEYNEALESPEELSRDLRNYPKTGFKHAEMAGFLCSMKMVTGSARKPFKPAKKGDGPNRFSKKQS
ncbi:MAG: hypothetical protein IIB64_02280 [Proteobacteria bacterium]|nr:hypothetical protein [Pseudomonadota bacterium]